MHAARGNVQPGDTAATRAEPQNPLRLLHDGAGVDGSSGQGGLVVGIVDETLEGAGGGVVAVQGAGLLRHDPQGTGGVFQQADDEVVH